MNGGPSGFHNAPVTKTFVIACALFTIFLGIQGRSSTLGLSYQDVFGKLHLWRFLASFITFSSTPELMFGLYLLYYFRVFERQIGSNKYSVFILFSVIISSLFEVLTLAFLKGPTISVLLMPSLIASCFFLNNTLVFFLRQLNYSICDPTLNILASGPYGLIFSSFVPFYFDIPVSTRFRIFGINFSDKSFIYLAGLQLLLSSLRRSVIPGMCGILAGSLYHLNILHIRRMKFPEFVTSFFSRLYGLYPGGSSPRSSSRNITGTAPSFVGRQVERNYPTTLHASTTEPPEDSIATLVSMGFDRNSARQALVHARNDINVATNILLEAQSH